MVSSCIITGVNKCFQYLRMLNDNSLDSGKGSYCEQCRFAPTHSRRQGRTQRKSSPGWGKPLLDRLWLPQGQGWILDELPQAHLVFFFSSLSLWISGLPHLFSTTPLPTLTLPGSKGGDWVSLIFQPRGTPSKPSPSGS